jgi:hypothetical protein
VRPLGLEIKPLAGEAHLFHVCSFTGSAFVGLTFSGLPKKHAMNVKFKNILSAAAISAFLSCSIAHAQLNSAPEPAPANSVAEPANPTKTAPPADVTSKFENAIAQKKNTWYFSWGYSRQWYAPSDIHVSQPGLGNDFTVHQATASDFPSSIADTLAFSSDGPNLTGPQENVRIGKFLDSEETFAIEFSLDHTKYNTDLGQTARVTGTVNGQPVNTNMVLDDQRFNYALHNGLNHIMINAVWLRHLYGPEKQAGDLQLVSKLGAGILLPHADNTIFGNQNQVGPKNQRICCSSGDWWQLNGWTVGVEVGFRYFVSKGMFLELTAKEAYGALKGVPVYNGSADQEIWMTEAILSVGFLF